MAIGTSGRSELKTVKAAVLDYYAEHKRELPWRDQLSTSRTQRLYQILVSEMMLQQTQVKRVLPKYYAWLLHLPTLEDCANASLATCLQLWQGLGYNRRARYLHDACCALQEGGIPHDLTMLSKYKGIGPNTAAAIAVYCDQVPHAFIETNIRTVLLHHVFTKEISVSDSAMMSVVQTLLPPKNEVREWYWGLMDYGTHLKSHQTKHHQRATNYKKQSRFHGSRRQLRGTIIRFVVSGPVSSRDLRHQLRDDRLERVVQDLINEGLVVEDNGILQLPGS